MEKNKLKISVVGVGVIGSGVAFCFAQAGYNVLLVDVSETALDQALNRIKEQARLMRLISSNHELIDSDKMLQNIRKNTSFDALNNSDIVIENVSEKWEIKQKVYKKMDMACGSACVFIANPSVFPISRIASLVSYPGRVIGVHFMNPVPMKSTVEMIIAKTTSKEVLESVNSILADTGKEAICVGDHPGFVSNRIMMPMINDAIKLVSDGVACVSAIDDVFKKCFSHKMGPLETADLIGLDTVLNSLVALENSLNDKRFTPTKLLVEMVSSGKTGRKSGCGFYDYKARGSLLI